MPTSIIDQRRDALPFGGLDLEDAGDPLAHVSIGAIRRQMSLRDALRRAGRAAGKPPTPPNSGSRPASGVADPLQAHCEELFRHGLERAIHTLRSNEEFSFLLNRVCPEAQRKLLTDRAFRENFLSSNQFMAYVVSIDIRRSTELMLKARGADHFARFLSQFGEEIETLTRGAYGIFDKFTGDGTLAFFPEFLSGPDAGYYALQTASRSHEVFRACCREHRASFTSMLEDAGLGIGIDYGQVHVVRMASGLTMVGRAVVYACRLAGAPPGRTYVNHPAFAMMLSRYGDHLNAGKTVLEVKHDGPTLCHDVELRSGECKYEPQKPPWFP